MVGRRCQLLTPIQWSCALVAVESETEKPPSEPVSALSTEHGAEFVRAMNKERANVPGGAKNMGCLAWKASLAEDAKTVAENCFISMDNSTYGYLKSTWQGEFEQYLTVPATWATPNQDFDTETMKCKDSGRCDDFLQSTYYKRGKIGCAYNTKCGRPDYFFVCAFENKIPKGIVPYEKGSQCSSCAQDEKCTTEKCCHLGGKEEDQKKNDDDKKKDEDKKKDDDDKKKDDNDKKNDDDKKKDDDDKKKDEDKKKDDDDKKKD
ncbi:CAP domain containing protein, partial [Trichuris trichiura]